MGRPARCRSDSTPSTAPASRARAADPLSSRPALRSAAPTYVRDAPHGPEVPGARAGGWAGRARAGAVGVDAHGGGGGRRGRLRAGPDREVGGAAGRERRPAAVPVGGRPEDRPWTGGRRGP